MPVDETFHFLRRVPVFADLPEQDLERLCRMAERVDLKASEVLFAEGSPADRIYVIEDGQLEVLKTSGGHQVLLAVRGRGDVIGEMPLLEQAPRLAAVRARSASRLLSIHRDQVEDLLDKSPSAARAILQTVLGRWRMTEALLRENEKMAQLGTLTAGVAHELNNPAAGVKRSAGLLREAFSSWRAADRALSGAGLTTGQFAQLEELAERARQATPDPIGSDALARNDREAALEAWLDARAVADAWDLAPVLVDLGYDEDALEMIAGQFAAALLPSIITWLAATHRADTLLSEIGQGAGRISEIVQALKFYVYLDQAPVQLVDIHHALDNTLVILADRLAGLNVIREYCADMPRIEAYGSELNQVWTNLIANAADALAGHGTITIRTRLEDGWVVVEIVDDGPGIPEAILPRIFDPFFTTKSPGKGAGLGLSVSYSTVANKHGGDIQVSSRPGQTCFRVRLPIEPAQR